MGKHCSTEKIKNEKREEITRWDLDEQIAAYVMQENPKE